VNKNTTDILKNLMGNGLPLLAALYAIPRIIETYGLERFGYISLFWVLIGSFSLFDFGLSRTLTHFVAESKRKEDDGVSRSLVWGLIVIICACGLVGGGILYIAGHVYLGFAPVKEAVLAQELRDSVFWIAAAIPLTTAGIAFRGVLEGLLRFGVVNAVRIPVGVLAFIGLLAQPVTSRGLVGAAFLLFFLRFLMAFLYGISVSGNMGKPGSVVLRASGYRSLLVAGGWMTVSNVVSPLLVYLDRLMLGFLVGPVQLAIYATSFETASRILFIPGAVSGVLFPSVASRTCPETVKRMILKSCMILLPLFVVPCLVLGIFSRQILGWWIDPAFADSAHVILTIISAGIILNGYSHLSFAFVQGMGRPDLTAKIHLIELAVFLVVLTTFVYCWGALGAAISWVLRASLDLILLTLLSVKLLKEYSHASVAECLPGGPGEAAEDSG